MNSLLKELRHNPMLWLLALVPVALVAAKLAPAAHTLLFVLSVLAIVPLAALLSHATESVAEKTGDAAGGLLNATLGNLTELLIAATALRAGEYTLVKGSVAGAIVTNTLFMARSVLFPRRSQAPRPGVQPRQRPATCRLALTGHNCAPEPFGDR
jgi:Ca2+:H+ antiporter